MGRGPDGRGIGSLVIARITASSVSRRNSRRPDSASHSTTPSENTSERWSTGSPEACSGDMYSTLPLRPPTCVSLMRPCALRDAEVDHLHRALERDQDVLRRDVAMNDVQRPAVGVGERVRVSERRGRARRR